MQSVPVARTGPTPGSPGCAQAEGSRQSIVGANISCGKPKPGAAGRPRQYGHDGAAGMRYGEKIR